MEILLGNGDGTFRAAASLATGSDPMSIAVGDFNGDGIPDLATANAQANTVTVLLGNGDGTFTPTATSPGTGDFPQSIAVGDFNGDGIPDLAVASWSNTVTVLLGNGDGTFTPTAVSPATGSYPWSVAVGDFNGDGIPDLAVTDQYSSTVTVLLGNGDGISDLAVTGADTVGVLLAQLTQTATAPPIGISLPVNTATHLVEASYSGDTNFQASISGKIGLFTGAEAQTITFPNPGTQTYGTPLTLNATASSGLAVSFASTTTSVCTVSGNTAIFLIAGTCTIQATQARNGDYLAATPVSQSFTVNHATQTITFPNPGTQTYGGLPFTLSATASSGLPVSYASTTSTICTVSASTVTLKAIGTCGITATQPGNNDYAAAAAVSLTFPVVRNQTITFPAIPTTTLVTGSVTLNATATSHLPISYSSTNTKVCTVSGSTVTLLNLGTCGIRATQAGNGIVPPAPQVGHAFLVTLATQTITFARPATQWFGEVTFNLNATASSGLPVSYTSTTPSIRTVSGSTVTLLSLGDCGIWASQAGNTYYAAAPQFGHVFLVAKEAQTITFPAIPTTTLVTGSVTLNATASSGLPVSYASTTPSICTVSGSTVTLLSLGDCGIWATQAGNTYYAAAPEIGHMFLVAKEAQTITFPNPGEHPVGTSFTLNATASSGLPVSFTSMDPSVCTVSGSTVSLLNDSTYCGILADQAGNAYYNPAPEVGHMFLVGRQ